MESEFRRMVLRLDEDRSKLARTELEVRELIYQWSENRLTLRATSRIAGESIIGWMAGWEANFKSVLIEFDDGQSVTIDPREFDWEQLGGMPPQRHQS